MKKQELIHLHGLLAHVQNHYEKETGKKVDNDLHSQLGVQPTLIHRSKTEHKAAVFALADEITSEMEDGNELSEQVLEQAEDMPEDADEVYETLARNSLGVAELGDESYPVVEVTEELLEEIGAAAEEYLSRMDGGMIETEGDVYGPGTEVYLKV